MLSPKALEARMWGPFPTLSSILPDKRVPDHYYGPTSVSDNVFNRIERLLEVMAIVRENTPLIRAAIEAEAKQQERQRTDAPSPLIKDLRNLENAFFWARSVFDEAIHDLHSLR